MSRLHDAQDGHVEAQHRNVLALLPASTVASYAATHSKQAGSC